ncbi:MAG: phenylalanine--tRNA ligase subunit beta [Thermoanaerobacterales bacterium]|nr:phenylalanine--tRNA ligase subunit beta [Bacillota bacterium]MDI6907512.1 phenylalanine--tRNA ligase subunit beta [Thermoanaerobacterales bacterium]
MRVSYNWLKEFVDIDVPPGELAERLTFAGVAVESVEERGKDVSGVVTGVIKEVKPHPNADRLVICMVDGGRGGEPYQIVTGAPNVRAGQVVPVALDGARLAGGMVIRKARFRGTESRGMLCAADELGIGEDHEGILILPPDTPVGVDVKAVLGLDDAILELDLTPNRGDCLSVFGVAREVAAIYRLPLKRPRPAFREEGPDAAGRMKVEITDPGLCLRYVARLITGITVGPSPLWMQNRLTACGMRPINNIVDVTNYVMLELGQPLHAFDFGTVRDGRIIVRPAEPGERLVTLDGVERQLTPEMLLIAGVDRPLGLAGVMGGLDSEVTSGTKEVLLESACFNPVNIRRTARALGLRSEASNRFEKGIDISRCALAADRAVELMARMQAGTPAPGRVDNFPAPPPPKTVILRPARVNQILGLDVPRAEVEGILARLEFNPQPTGAPDGELVVTVPPHRPDILAEIDLIEEVARLYGYDKVPETLPFGETTPARRSREQQILSRLKLLLAGLGFNETATYSFVDPGQADRMRLDPAGPLREAEVVIANPLNEDQAVMRTQLFPGLVEMLARNYQRRNTDAALFEISTVFRRRPPEQLPEERLTLALAAIGKTPRGWNRRPQEMDFYFLKGALEQVLRHLGVGVPEFVPEKGDPSFHPGRTAAVMVQGRRVAVVGELHPDVLEAYDLPVRAVAAEVNLARLLALEPVEWVPESLPRFPAVERDLAVVIPDTVAAAEAMALITASGGEYLREVRLFDVYRGRQIPEGYHSLAFTLRFLALDRTLTDDEVNRALDGIRRAFQERLGAQMRT